MKLYSDFARRRAGQIVGDVAAVAVVVVGIVVAVAIHDAIAGFRTIGADVTRSGNDFASTMSDIGSRLSGVPLIGGGISAPFGSASDAGGALAAAGTSWQTGVERPESRRVGMRTTFTSLPGLAHNWNTGAAGLALGIRTLMAAWADR